MLLPSVSLAMVLPVWGFQMLGGINNNHMTMRSSAERLRLFAEEKEEEEGTSTGKMFDLAARMLEVEAAEAVDGVRFTKCTEGDEVLVYVPGIEFRGVSIGAQLEALERENFETWIAFVDGATDRSSFQTLSSAVSKFCQMKNASVLLGESFGGLVALDVALDYQEPLKVALLNPATSFRRSLWSSANAGALVAGAPTPRAYAAAIMAAVGLLASDASMVGKSVNEVLRGELQILNRAWTSARTLADFVPKGTLAHRLEAWLDDGAKQVDQKLFLASRQWRHSGLRSRRKQRGEHDDIRFLVVAGDDDRFLPSKQEAYRLARLLPENRTQVRTLRGGGHALLVDPKRLDLGKALRSTKLFYPAETKKKDPIDDFVPPTREAIVATRTQFVDPFRRLFSPVFFSRRSKESPVIKGLGAVPIPRDLGRPVLLVGPHQLFGLDLGVLIDEFIRERDVLVRGLAHPAATGAEAALAAFRPSSGVTTTSPSWWGSGKNESNTPFAPTSEEETFFTRFGAVEVTPRNFFRLMQNNSMVLLFPGGVRESNHGKNEAYKLFWPNSTDFVRVAAKFNAVVVPFGAVGIADSFSILRDKDAPLFSSSSSDGETPRMPSARRWAGDDSEDFRFPLAVPDIRKGPARVYVYFQPPRDTMALDPKDRSACADFYTDVKSDVEAAITALLEARSHDPFERPGPRVAYETIANGSPLGPAPGDDPFRDYRPAQAPTFPIGELQRRL